MLKYIGGGFIPGVPARDLSEAEVDAIHKELLINKFSLVESGLYVEVKVEVTVHENKIMRQKSENKVGG